MRITSLLIIILSSNICFSQNNERESSIDLDEYNEYELLDKGNKYIQEGDTIKSMECYNLALKKNSNLYEAVTNLGHIYYEDKDFDSAERHFDRSVKIAQDKKNKSLSESFYYLGNSQLSNAIISIEKRNPNIPKIEESISSYEESLKINPDNIDAKQNLAFAMELSKRYPKDEEEGEKKDKEQDEEEEDLDEEEEQKESESNKDLEEAIKNIDQLIKEQKKLKEKTQNNNSSDEELSKEQEGIKEEFNNIKESLKSLNERESESDQQTKLPDFEEEQKDAEENMTESKELLERNKKDESTKKQNEIIENLEDISEKLTEVNDDNYEQQEKQNLTNEQIQQILYLLQNLDEKTRERIQKDSIKTITNKNIKDW